jgi:glycosyltransferase involved in cell wall biosynthesis
MIPFAPINRTPNECRDRLRVLVLSHMFPSAASPHSGPFVHEQVRALREHAQVDARVVVGRPLPLNCFRPARLGASLAAYLDLHLAWEDQDDVPTVYVPFFGGGFVRRWLFGRTYSRGVIRAADWLQQDFAPHLIHAHTAYLDGGAARALARRWGIPYVITEHTGPFSLLTQNLLIRRWTRRALQDAARVWCVSDALGEEVRRFAGDGVPVSTLGNGVDLDRFFPPTQWRPRTKSPRLLGVMSLDSNKDPFCLLRAFVELRKEVPGACLILVGAGPLRASVQNFVQANGLSHRVILRDPCNRDEVARLMRESCDILVSSSRSETFGVVLVEALASGKPVVATRSGGPESIIRHRWLGRLCPAGDPAALCRALADAIAGLPGFEVERIRAHAAATYSYENLAGRLREQYEQLVFAKPAEASAPIESASAA